MADILFLAPDDLGETVLATGALAHVLREGDALTICAGREARALFRAAPGMHDFISAESALAEGLTARLRLRRFDALIDARGDLAARAFPAVRRYALTPSPILRHRCEAWAEAVGAERPLAAKLWLDDAARRAAGALDPGDGRGLLILAPGGVTEGKRWPQERFAAVARRLASGPLADAGVLVLSAAARDAAVVAGIVRSLDADGVAARGIGVELDLLAAAALMERATLCLGNDNALTHIAAAMGAPVLALFGPTDERVRGPHGPRARTLRGRAFELAAAGSELDARAAMEDVSIDAVEAAALEILHAGGLR
ncbi:MAG: glycosyltransferase family 9 protein [Hyphomonadaceae bacterium]